MGVWTRHSDPRIEETLREARIPGGPAVFVLPLPGYAKKYASFATRFGSIDNWFRLPDRPEPIRCPDGVAHFLEHQMFAQEDGDAFERFAALGASANAFTSYTSTTYMFTATENFGQALAHLLDFVQQPHFTDAGTAKERAIIQQEIRMYQDHPGWRLRQMLHGALYREHPFRLDIAGSVESVGAIATADLRLCYETFYHPANMVVTVVGDVDPERVLADVAASLDRHPRGPWRAPERLLPEEPAGVAAHRVEEAMGIARPMVAVGWKEGDVPASGLPLVRRDLETEIGLDAIFGESSDLYRRLYEEGIADAGFGADHFGESTFGATRVGGETDRPEALVEAILAAARAARRDGVPAEACDRLRRARLGDFIREWNAPEGLGQIVPSLHWVGVDLFTYGRALEEVTAGAVARRMARHLDPEACTVACVRPSRPDAAS